PWNGPKDKHYKIVRILPDECFALNSRDKVRNVACHHVCLTMSCIVFGLVMSLKSHGYVMSPVPWHVIMSCHFSCRCICNCISCHVVSGRVVSCINTMSHALSCRV